MKGGSVIYACFPSSEQLNSTCLPDGKFDNPPICGEGNQGGNKTVFMMTGDKKLSRKRALVLHFSSFSHWSLFDQRRFVENGDNVSDFWFCRIKTIRTKSAPPVNQLLYILRKIKQV